MDRVTKIQNSLKLRHKKKQEKKESEEKLRKRKAAYGRICSIIKQRGLKGNRRKSTSATKQESTAHAAGYSAPKPASRKHRV